PNGEWRGTISNEGHRNAYLHTRLKEANGRSATGTEVFIELGLAHKGSLEFDWEGPADLRLTRIVDCGAWPTGRSPAERGASTPLPSPRPVAVAIPRAPAAPG